VTREDDKEKAMEPSKAKEVYERERRKRSLTCQVPSNQGKTKKNGGLESREDQSRGENEQKGKMEEQEGRKKTKGNTDPFNKGKKRKNKIDGCEE